jgi:hypothetical protein
MKIKKVVILLKHIPKVYEVESFPVYFRYVMTTQRPLKNAHKNKHICPDSTYKLIYRSHFTLIFT